MPCWVRPWLLEEGLLTYSMTDHQLHQLISEWQSDTAEIYDGWEPDPDDEDEAFKEWLTLRFCPVHPIVEGYMKKARDTVLELNPAPVYPTVADIIASFVREPEPPPPPDHAESYRRAWRAEYRESKASENPEVDDPEVETRVVAQRKYVDEEGRIVEMTVKEVM